MREGRYSKDKTADILTFRDTDFIWNFGFNIFVGIWDNLWGIIEGIWMLVRLVFYDMWVLVADMLDELLLPGSEL
ncbi:MAG: hypothetical protein U0176_15125 [Bacteroidia bacterium]